MNGTTNRMRVPIVMAVLGTTIAVASLIGRGLADALLVEAVTALATLGYYRVGAHDTDAGALIGGRADERQETHRVEARARAGQAVTTFALAGFVVQTARGADVWPFALVCMVAAVAFASAVIVPPRS